MPPCMLHVIRTKHMDKRMVTMDIYGMQGALDNVTLRQVNLTENKFVLKKLTLNLL